MMCLVLCAGETWNSRIPTPPAAAAADAPACAPGFPGVRLRSARHVVPHIFCRSKENSHRRETA